jgi:prepilin-type N-terminal cleavage/methylation domain-containing protein
MHNSEFRRPTVVGTPNSELRRRGFTLMELLIVILIISILAALALAALAGATEQAREMRTRSIVNKLDQLIMEKYESYRTRAVPIRVPVSTSSGANGAILAARTRLYALRELMRLELPDRISDLCDQTELGDLSDTDLDAINNRNAAKTSLLTTMPSAAASYKRRAQRNIAANGKAWTTAHQGAECLYLIISTMRDGDKSAIDFFDANEIGDVDEDGFKEILDGWGQPIEFLRWAPGYISNNATATLSVATPQTSDYLLAPDPYDPLKCDPRWSDTNVTQKPFALMPLIYSAGKNRSYDINIGIDATTNTALVYANTANPSSGNVQTWTVPPSDPFFASSPWAGTPSDADSDGALGFGDNITNHYQETP